MSGFIWRPRRRFSARCRWPICGAKRSSAPMNGGCGAPAASRGQRRRTRGWKCRRGRCSSGSATTTRPTAGTTNTAPRRSISLPSAPPGSSSRMVSSSSSSRPGDTGTNRFGPTRGAVGCVTRRRSIRASGGMRGARGSSATSSTRSPCRSTGRWRSMASRPRRGAPGSGRRPGSTSSSPPRPTGRRCGRESTPTNRTGRRPPAT